MGSPLGPTFAVMFIYEIENKKVSQPDQSNTRYFRKDVDDILAIFNRTEDLETFESKMQSSSVLEFAHDEARGKWKLLSLPGRPPYLP